MFGVPERYGGFMNQDPRFGFRGRTKPLLNPRQQAMGNFMGNIQPGGLPGGVPIPNLPPLRIQPEGGMPLIPNLPPPGLPGIKTGQTPGGPNIYSRPPMNPRQRAMGGIQTSLQQPVKNKGIWG